MNRYYAMIERKPNDEGYRGHMTREYEAATPEAALDLAETELEERHEDERYKVSQIKLRVWPVPTMAAKYRAQAHNSMAVALHELASKAVVPAMRKVIEDEVKRQHRMTVNYSNHYRPNAGL